MKTEKNIDSKENNTGSSTLAQKSGKDLSNNTILFSMLAILLLFFSIMSSDFRSMLNIVEMLKNMAPMAIAAAGLTLVMISGGMDISVGGNVALTSTTVALLYNLELPIGYVIVLGLLVGFIIGLINGLLITQIGLNPIICTLGMMAVTRGIAFVISDGKSILVFDNVLGFIGRGSLLKIPFPIIMIVIIYVILHIISSYTKMGRKIYVIGSNKLSAFFSGVKVNRNSLYLYILCGLLASLAGLTLTSLSAVGMPQHGMGLELQVIAAIILGGTALGGGKGTIFGTILGVLIVTVIYNGLTMLNVKYYFTKIVHGAILISVVAAYEIRKRKIKV